MRVQYVCSSVRVKDVSVSMCYTADFTICKTP